MVHTLKLRALMVEQGLTNDTVAKTIGISKQSFSLKANNKREFTISEVYKIMKLLQLTEQEVVEIFFAVRVELNSTCEQK